MTILSFRFLVGQRERPTVRRRCIRAACDFSHLTLAGLSRGPSRVSQHGPYRHAVWRPVVAQRLPVTFPGPSLFPSALTQALAPPLSARPRKANALVARERLTRQACHVATTNCGEHSVAATNPNVKGPVERRTFHMFRLRARLIPFRTGGTGRCLHSAGSSHSLRPRPFRFNEKD
jgi:hypothetical protein